MNDSIDKGLTPQTEAERSLAELSKLLGKEGGIRPEFAREVLERISGTHEAAQSVMDRVESESAPAKTEPPAPEPGLGNLKDRNLIPRTALDPQARKYVEDLVTNEGQGYNLAHNTLTDGGLYNPEEEGIIKAPTMEEALAILQRDLSMEEVEAIRRLMKVPGLALQPEGLPWRRFVSNLDTGTRNRFDTSVSASRQREFDRQDRALGIKADGGITGWKVGLEETEKEPANQSGLLKDIIRRLLESEAAKVLGLQTHKANMRSQKRALLSGDRRPLDTTGWAILQRADKPQEGESPIICPDGLVSGGDYAWNLWLVARVNFAGNNPCARYYNARLRFAVMKKA